MFPFRHSVKYESFLDGSRLLECLMNHDYKLENIGWFNYKFDILTSNLIQ